LLRFLERLRVVSQSELFELDGDAAFRIRHWISLV
jgi:hypothetical protein